MDQYQRIAFVIAVISGAGFLAYVAADDIFLSFAQKHWREDRRCGKKRGGKTTTDNMGQCNEMKCFFSFAFCTFFKIFHVRLGKKVKVLVFRECMYV